MADEIDSYQRACNELRRAAAAWDHKALEYEHIALTGGEVIIGVDPTLGTHIITTGDGANAAAAQLRECAKEVHAYLDWTPTGEST